jgi:hypothetical protein
MKSLGRLWRGEIPFTQVVMIYAVAGFGFLVFLVILQLIYTSAKLVMGFSQALSPNAFEGFQPIPSFIDLVIFAYLIVVPVALWRSARREGRLLVGVLSSVATLVAGLMFAAVYMAVTRGPFPSVPHLH